ncbi:MAG: GreA/GreB family elongation factor [Patescibacteria group bacterium]
MTKTYHLTEEGLEKIEKELEELRQKRKNKTKNDVPNVLESEDLNPEYLDFREEIEFLEKRIAKLETVVKNTKIIEPPEDQSIVQLGAKVIIEADNQEDEFKLVGSLEADPAKGKISGESLVGKKLLGKKEGDKVKVSSKVETIYKIKKIEY